jgi:hypothetical protein
MAHVGDPIDKLLAIGSSADWITPVWAFIQDIRHGSAFHINIQRACGYSGAQIERMLRKQGVYVWGGMIVNDVFILTVRKTQAHYALYWLKQWGVPIDGHRSASGAGWRSW